MHTITKAKNHPGTIQLVDGETDEVIEHLNAGELPDEAKWEETDDGWVPIVRVVTSEAGGVRRLRMYGPDGALLRSVTE